MEFLSGYAAAKAPFPAYEVEPHHPPSRRSNRPTRSNSTSGAAPKKKSRIPGHARTNSASTSSSGRTEQPPQQQQQQQQQSQPQPQPQPPSSPHNFPWLRQAADDADGSADDTAPTTTHRTASPFPFPDHQGPRRDQRERMSASLKYYQDKQLPATPRLNTQDASSRYLATGSASEPASARTPASASVTTPSSFGNPASGLAPPGNLSAVDRRPGQSSAMFPDHGLSSKGLGMGMAARAESVSSVSAVTLSSSRTALSGDPPSGADAAAQQLRPFVVRNGRTFMSDPTLPYPLPVDLEENHRQSLKTLLLMQLFGRPICCPVFADKPPLRILDVGCGYGFWSMMCYRYYEARGQHAGMSFTGIDIAPIASGSGGPGAGNRSSSSSSCTGVPCPDARPDKDMNWRFVQHDLRKLPLPFPDGSFDFIMIKEMGLATSMIMTQALVDDYLRVLAPGGHIELWETDHTLRMLRPHVREPSASTGDDEGTDDEDEERIAASMGAYILGTQTPLSAPTNPFIAEYNTWVLKALEARTLFPMPCTVIEPLLLQEAETLTAVGRKRIAIPLSEVRWEREGVGGVVTKDGKSYIETKAKRFGKEGASAGQTLDPAAAALRRTALMIVVQMMQSLEHLLREASGKSQDEWDGWMSKMTNNLLNENGTNWGECLEAGAWWARKRKPAR